MKLKLNTYKPMEVETYACREGDNPIAAVIEAVLKDHERKKYVLASGDPRSAVEAIKKNIKLHAAGPNPNSGWLYTYRFRAFNIKIRIFSTTRLAEDLSYNPF